MTLLAKQAIREGSLDRDVLARAAELGWAPAPRLSEHDAETMTAIAAYLKRWVAPAAPSSLQN